MQTQRRSHRVLLHTLLPLAPTLLLLALVFTPLAMIGCRTRGFLALGIALTSGLVSLACAAFALQLRIRRLEGSGWWMASALLLILPLFVLLYLA